MFYLTTHSTHFIYGYMASDIWLRTILIVRKETRCNHIGFSYRLTARVILYAPSHRQDNTYHGLCYTSRGMWHKHTIAPHQKNVGSVASIASYASVIFREDTSVSFPELSAYMCLDLLTFKNMSVLLRFFLYICLPTAPRPSPPPPPPPPLSL